ncbi:hypothetical protein HELRODRAFT_79202, partial [Helobdella robusta]|uniref:C2H2-type domain-containing protein n=1 Tax=Helobdella robusta TaxID=6412 RepID=T1G3L4_HELRO
HTCANNSMLNRHMKNHSEVRSHSCQTCGASYKFLYKLKQHLLKHPSHVSTTDVNLPGRKET